MGSVRVVLAGLLALAMASGSKAAPPSLQQRLDALKAAYPDHIRRIESNELVMADGTRVVIDDGRAKDHQAKLADADVEDMLSQIYPIGACDRGQAPGRNSDPGRIRSTPFLMAMYGRSAKAAAAKLVAIDWFGRPLRVMGVNGVDRALETVRDDLAKLPRPLHRFFAKSAGTFNWRVIAGTSRPSVHSFGAAIDIDVAHADYWRWSGGKPGAVKTYRNRIPRAVVEVFERQGFIWGGKWYHYDTMHFEYRPELIRIGRLAEAAGCAR